MNRLVNIISIISLILTLGFGSALAQTRGPKIKGNVYGGGENAKVMGQNLNEGEPSTSVTINNGNVKGDVFGAGKGVTKSVAGTYEIDKKDADGNVMKDGEGNPVKETLTYDKVAVVYGNTEVKITAKSSEKQGKVWGNIYGGAALAIVDGETHVKIEGFEITGPDDKKTFVGGMFAKDVFGGGKGNVDASSNITSANVLKNTNVRVTGGEIIWNKKLDSNWEIVDAAPDEFFDSKKNKFKTDHNIYAGGDIACTVGTWNDEGTKLGDDDTDTGTSRLTMTRGLLNKALLTSDEWKSAFAEHENPHFYAFGGGYGIYTKAHKSEVNICLPMVGEEGTSGGDQQLARPHRTPDGGQSLPMPIITDAYGVAWTTVLGILGGGYNGHVEETNVLVGDATYAHRVYGGGLGSYDGWVDAGKPADMDDAALADGKVGTVGPLSGEPSDTEPVARVTLAGGHIYGDVFGGGAGVASGKEKQDGEGNWSIDRTAANNTFTDFTEIARVKGNTLVETTSYETYLRSKGTFDTVLDSHPNKGANTDPDENKQKAYPLYQRAQIFGNVYGGGDVANVSGNTNVSLFGGDVFGYAFGAGLGRLTTEAKDYTSIGNVSGNSTLTIADLVDWTDTSLPGDYNEPYKPSAWDDIYGGGRNGVTNGNAEVNINGGKLGNNIFGGGLGNVDGTNITSADVKGNTTVNVTGGSYQWREIADVNGNKKEFVDDQTITQEQLLNRMGFEAKLEPVKDFFSYRDLRYTRDHSIYGGGNVACNVGTYNTDDKTTAATEGGLSTVNMNHGLFADKDIMFTDEEFNIATLCRYLACNNSENTQFGVFGGGYGANTKVSETKVNLSMGQSYADKVLWGEYFGEIQTWYEGLSDDEKNSKYGGSSGENAYNRYFTARMAKSINVPSHTVLTAAGGGQAGYVAGNTSVTMDGHSGALRVFGGGIGMKPDDLETLNPTTAADLTYGQVGGDAKVKVNAGVVVQNVYGGGAGVESQRKEDDSYLDFPGMAHVLGKTDVSVGGYSPGTVVFGKVYGGGDVANVGIETGKTGATQVDAAQIVAAATGTTPFTDPQTKVTIDGGCVFQQVFAGGSGRTKNVCDDYTKLGAVYGNTQLVINNSTYTAEQATAANLAGTLVDDWTDKSAGDTNEPWLWDIVYGGGQNGTVYGNTDVQILGGNLGYDIFGGGWGYKTTSTEPGDDGITSADVTQNTNVRIMGGKWCLSQSWNGTERSWNAAKTKDDKTYSPQYDPEHKKFNIDHNVYGGGNVACAVGTYNNSGDITSGGNAYVYVTKGMLVENAALGHTYEGSFFEQPEWENVYAKHASPHFSVFGGGYGFNTKVEDTYVNVNMGTTGTEPSNDDIASKPSSQIFVTQQTLMDVIGGGYEGAVNHTCHVDIDGYTFMRNAFGGAYYAMVGNTEVNVTRANMDNVYGGGMMGDVKTNVNVRIGTEAVSPVSADDAKSWNANLIINEDVYGANDVAGYVGAVSNEYGDIAITAASEGVKLKLNGGHIHGNVYGGGNGNYLYKIDEEVTQVSVLDDETMKDKKQVTLYRVPLRISDFPSLSAMSDQQKMANVISYRPSTMKTDIDFKGNSETDRLRIDGNIFGGGNSATINDFDGPHTGDDAHVKINVGSHIKVGGVYLGSDGEALFASQHGYMTYFPEVNDLRLYDHIDWTTPENQNIPEKFLPTPPAERPEIYKNNLDLYFMPVEMAVMPEVTWGANRLNNSVWIARGTDDKGSEYTYNADVETEAEFTDAEIGTFCCGGNRGNMDTPTLFHINFPAGLTITENIIGGCNNANYTYNIPGQYDSDGNQLTIDHTGGFLLGTHGVGADHDPQINLTLRNKFFIERGADGLYPEKCNVFGGCYRGGTVRGDIRLEVLSNMLMSATNGEGLDAAALRSSIDAKPSRTVCGVYGGGYGSNTWVYGDTDVRLGNASIACTYTEPGSSTGGKYSSTGTSCNQIFGGGREGSVVGNTAVRVLNGHVGSDVVGASYSGYLYGNSQVIVGYRKDYYVCQKSGKYKLNRVDSDPQHAYYVDANGKPVIKQDVWLTKGDLVAKASYDELDAAVQNTTYFTPSTYITYPDNVGWSNINIQIDKAIYGGGYALAGGGSVGAGSYTVRKYTNKYNLNEYAQSVYELPDGGTLDDDNGSAAGGSPYGGNTFVMIGDRDGNDNRDHITISSSQLKPITPKVGDNLFGKYYEVRHGTDTPEDATDDFVTIEYVRVDRIYDDSMSEEKFYEYTGEGGIYGDGHLSLAEGFRLSDMLAYGYNGSAPVNAKLMNCIHRFDIVRLKDCCFSLLGDRDYASTAGIAVDATPYSLANVGELKMISSLSKDGVYMDPLKNSRSRNYMGLSNRVTNVGAVYSDVSFEEDKFHHGNEGKYNDPSAKKEEYGVGDFTGLTYKAFKQKMIETYYDCTTGKVKDTPGAAINFQLRNDGTAKNLIGIGSGYALIVDYEFDRQKTQENLTEHEQPNIPENQGIDGTYYGPVKGVFEVNLISVRDGEAGGYVYAQNIHEDASYGSAYGNENHLKHFLEASGNFVFPVTSQRKVIDDCFPVKYNGEHKHSDADGHYWYVTGLKYFYNATITGYTFDDQEMTFDMANSNLFTLAGAKAGQEVWLEDFHIVNRHVANDYACDFERDVNGDHTGYDLLNQTDATEANKKDKYMFSISTSKLNSYTESYEEDGNTVNVPYLQTMHLNELGVKQTTKLSDNTLDVNDAPISIRITDNVNNNGKVSETKSYYEAHLSDPCQAVILLTVPAKDDNGFVVYNNDLFDQWDKTGDTAPVAGKQYYILNFDGTYLGVKEADLVTYDTQEKRKLLYVLKDYRKLTEDEKKSASPDASVTYYTKNGSEYTAVDKNAMTDDYWTNNKNNLYVVPTPVKYEYTIDLTIRYIKGPSHSGHIDIKNCALPGEMIRLSHENVIIESDENSLPHNGNFWIIGPGKKVWEDPADHSKGWHWEFIDDYMGAQTRTGVDLLGNSGSTLHYSDPASRNLYYPYNPYIDDPKDNYRGRAYNTLMTEGMYHPNSAESKEYFLPAYYYMDGYVAQYCYTVQNINRVFRTEIQPVDTFCIHNYHRMVNANDMESNTGEKKIPHDLFVPWAAENGRRPRVYIEDVDDLKAFAEYLARTADTNMPTLTILPSGSDGITQDVTYAEVIKPASNAGANTDFILMADITVPDNWEPIANFNGALHGNGHVISGLGENALFASLGKNAHIYNLGLPTGKITTTEQPVKYSCCYTYANKTVYRKNGDAYTEYTDDDWRYGRVAYDLNEFYLAERLDRHDRTDVHAHDGYVEALYADGDYRYARYNVSPATSEYLRNDVAPLYAWGNDPVVTDLVDNDDDAHISKHDYEYDKENNVLSHRVDDARAYFNNDAENPVLSEYRPLIDEAKVNSTEDLTIKKNDYIFFGQTLNVSTVTAAEGTVGSSLPTVVSASANTTTPGNAAGVTHAVDNQTNRVWRTYGFYKSKKDDAFHFNRAAWALHKDLTAIDFTGAHDGNHSWKLGMVDGDANSEQFFYPMPMDVPKDNSGVLNLTSFNVMSNSNYNDDGTLRNVAQYANENYGAVTQNLLVYNNGESAFAYTDVNNSLESAVLYHNIVKSGSPATYSTDYFHLVDKQDYNAPIAFDVNTRAWYERMPMKYRNFIDEPGVYQSATAWEGIVLPFTATKVSATENGEISHFYGEDIADPKVNDHTLHHEYWLNGLVEVTDAGAGTKNAIMARPSKTGEGLFTDAIINRQEVATDPEYTYPANTYFTELTNYTDYHDDLTDDAWARTDPEWYLTGHKFENYVYLSKSVPYIIAFPGNDFYEFSLEGQNYNRTTHRKDLEDSDGNKLAQRITFEAANAAVSISDEEIGAHTSTANGYRHIGTYLRESSDTYMAMDDKGSAFVAPTSGQKNTILPFRTYMTAATAPANLHRVIRISDGSKGESIVEPGKPEKDMPNNYLKVWTEGHDIVIEASSMTSLKLYTISGIMLDVLNCKPGINRFPQSRSGIYVVGKKKLIVK